MKVSSRKERKALQAASTNKRTLCGRPAMQRRRRARGQINEQHRKRLRRGQGRLPVGVALCGRQQSVVAAEPTSECDGSDDEQRRTRGLRSRASDGAARAGGCVRGCRRQREPPHAPPLRLQHISLACACSLARVFPSPRPSFAFSSLPPSFLDFSLPFSHTLA
eukprot:2571600-Pleurochrysis_carterae.AAC.1